MRGWTGRAVAASGGWGLCLILMTGCAGFFVYPGSTTGGTGTTGSGDYVYVANATAETLAGFEVGSGTLTAVTNSSYTLGFVPTSVAVNPANTIVFVAGTNGVYGFINAYAIGTGGALTLLTSNNTGSAGEVSIDVSPDGDWLVGLDTNGSTVNEAIVDEYAINSSTGQLTLETNTGGTYTYTGSVPTIVPQAIKFAPNEDYVFVAVGTAGDLVFPFSKGVFSTPQALIFPAGSTSSDNALAVNSTSSTLFISRSGTNGGLAVYTIGSGGALSEVSGSPLTAGDQPISVVINLAGSDVYLANQLSTTISGYSISSSGTVAALSPATDSLVSAPRALAVDSSGNYLLAASNAGSPDLSMYSYDATTAGKLDFVTSIPTGSDPTGAIAIAATH
jgi:6-phosphogluconolactonase